MIYRKSSSFCASAVFTGLLFIILFSVLINNAFSQWVQVSAMPGPVLAIESNGTTLTNGNEIIYVGEGNVQGVWKSTDNGQNWTQTNLNNKTVYSLAANGTYVWAGTDEVGVYFSSNSGNTWTQTSMNNRTVYSLEIMGSYLYAGTSHFGVYCSADNGSTWFHTPLNNKTVFSLSASANYLLAGTDSSGVYRSTNYGTTWTQTSLTDADVLCFRWTQSDVFAGTDGQGIWMSSDYGMNWTDIGGFFSCNNISGYELGRYLICGTFDGIYQSTDYSTNWTPRNEGLPFDPQVEAIRLIDDIEQFLAGVSSNRDGAVSYGIYRRPIQELIGIQPISNHEPNQYSLLQNYPNPFNPKSKIRYDIAKLGNVKLIIYDVLGRQEAVLVNEHLKPGTYEVEWDASNNPSGAYFYKLTAGEFSETKKMILIK